MVSKLKKYSRLFGVLACLVAGTPLLAMAAENDHVHETKKSAKYYCPMHPQVVSDKPGECPICHMRLVLDTPVMAGVSQPIEGRIPVVVPDASRSVLDIRTHLVETKPLRKTIEAWGRVAHDPELYQLQIDFLRTERLEYERVRDRTPQALKRGLTEREKIEFQFLDMGLSQEWVDALEKAGVPDRKLLYHHTENAMWIYLDLREKEVSYVKSGDPVMIQIIGLEGLKLEGRVEFIDSKIDHEKGTLRVRVLVKEAPESLKPGMAVSASLAADLGNVLVVPEDSPLFTGSRAIVFVDENGFFKPREVTLGAKANGFYEVKEGLMPGEKVASSGNFFIDSESRLRAGVESSGHGSHAS